MATQAIEDFRDGVDECYVDDVIDDKALNSSKLRSTNGVTEISIIVMVLALNEMSTKHDSLSVNDQHSTMKVLCANWADLLATDYPSLGTHMAKVKVTREHLKQMID